MEAPLPWRACFLPIGLGLEGASDDAKRIAEEILSIDPDFSLAKYADTQLFRDAATLDLLVDCLREAGLPE